MAVERGGARVEKGMHLPLIGSFSSAPTGEVATSANDSEAEALTVIGNEMLEGWRVAMADGDTARIGQLVAAAHANQAAKRTLDLQRPTA